MSEYMECPGCGEIELKYLNTIALNGENLREYRCRCGYYATFGVLPEVDTVGIATPKYPGVREAMLEVGYEVLDSASQLDVFRLGFLKGREYELKGREYELKKDIEASKKILAETSIKEQAE